MLSGKQVCRILEKAGYLEVRRTGSHAVMQLLIAEGDTTTVIVPWGTHDLAIGTLIKIIKQSGLTKEAFGIH